MEHLIILVKKAYVPQTRDLVLGTNSSGYLPERFHQDPKCIMLGLHPGGRGF